MTLFETYRLKDYDEQIHADIWRRQYIVYHLNEGMHSSSLMDDNDLLVDVDGAIRIKP